MVNNTFFCCVTDSEHTFSYRFTRTLIEFSIPEIVLLILLKARSFWYFLSYVCEITSTGLGGEREKLQVRRQECVRPKSLSRFDLKQHHAERSLYDIKAPRELQRADGSAFFRISQYFDVKRRSVCTLLLQIEYTSSHEPVRFDGTLWPNPISTP